MLVPYQQRTKKKGALTILGAQLNNIEHSSGIFAFSILVGTTHEKKAEKNECLPFNLHTLHTGAYGKHILC